MGGTGFETAVPDRAIWHQQYDTTRPVLLIGDVHGCADELEDILEAADSELELEGGLKAAQVIFVGDLVNKGPKSVECIRIARRLGALSVRGNHDHASIVAARQPAGDRGKGYSWTGELAPEELAYLEAMPFTIGLPAFDALVVHAGLVPGVPLELQSWGDMMMMRDLHGSSSGVWSATDKGTAASVPWAPEWRDGPHIYFGHDAKRGLQQCPRATGLDTGCLYGRHLTAKLLPSGKLICVKARRVHVVPGGAPAVTKPAASWTAVAKAFRRQALSLLLPLVPVLARALDGARRS